MINIGYFILREDLDSPIIRTQVINLIKEINTDPNYNITLIWAYRVDYIFKKNKYSDLIKELNDNGISFVKFPIIIGKFPLNKISVDFLSTQVNYYMKKIIQNKNLTCINVRGYSAAAVTKKLTDKVKIIFDSRSPYLTELKSTYNYNDSKMGFWIEEEKRICNASTYIIAISDKQKQYFKRMNIKNVETISNNVDILPKSEVQKLTKKNKRNSIVYVGSLNNGWNDINFYASYFKEILNKYPEIKIELYIRGNNVDEIKSIMKKNNVSEKSYSINSVEPRELNYLLPGAICGLQFFKNSDSRIGVKSVDYLSSGLSILCNKNALGASSLIDIYNVGYSVASNSEVAMGLNTILEKDYSTWEHNYEVAFNNFSSFNIAKKYRMIYENL